MKLKLVSILTLCLLIMVSIFQSCTISLSGATLDPELKTFYIPNFTNNAENALPSLSQRLTEDLKDKVRAESRLVLSEEEPDIEFRGTLVDYRITAEAPRTGESTAINRLTITFKIEMCKLCFCCSKIISASRLFFTSKGTSSSIFFSANVPGRSE